MTEVKLTISILLLIGIIDINQLKSHGQTTLMRMYKQIRKLHVKSHLERSYLKHIYMIYMLKVETVTKVTVTITKVF